MPPSASSPSPENVSVLFRHFPSLSLSLSRLKSSGLSLSEIPFGYCPASSFFRISDCQNQNFSSPVRVRSIEAPELFLDYIYTKQNKSSSIPVVTASFLSLQGFYSVCFLVINVKNEEDLRPVIVPIGEQFEIKDGFSESVSCNSNKSRLARTIAKVLHLRAATGIAPVDAIQKGNSQEFQKGSYQDEIGVQKARSQEIGIQKVKSKENENQKFKSQEIGIQKVQDGWNAPKVRVTLSQSFEKNNDKLQERAALEALLAKLFASISSVKAAYAELQYAQTPYDAEGIRAADHTVVDDLKKLSELKRCFLNKQFDPSPETTVVLAEIEEQKSVLKTYEIMGKKLESQVRLKDSEVIFLGEKLEEANKQNKLLEKRVYQSGQIYVPDNIHLSGLSPSHFVTVLRPTVKSIRSFVRTMMDEMKSAGWDIHTAAHSIDGGQVAYWKEDHKCFAFEHFVCREMFDAFQYANFSLPNEFLPDKKKQQQQLFFERFTELKPWKAKEYLFRNPKSAFAKFCRVKYLRLIHPKMETSFSGNLNQRNLVSDGEFPNTNFFSIFADMAKRVWLLHLLAFSFNPEAAIFQVSKGCRFSEVYMESVAEEAFQSTASEPLVGFTVVPGFRLGKTVIQCQVYLTSQLQSNPIKQR